MKRIMQLVAALCLLAAPALANDVLTNVWIEAESNPRMEVPFEATTTAKPGLLSGGKLILKTIDENKEERPKDGFLIAYDLDIPEAGQYQVWARIGYEWARPHLEWRLNGGDWTRLRNTVATTNVMELSQWNEIAWLHLGDRELSPGRGTLEVRFIEPKPGDRMLMALDCFALVRGEFQPSGKLKPGEQYDGAQDRQAASHVYTMPGAEGPTRADVSLSGLWQVARWDDPNMDDHPYEPETSLPEESQLRWMGIEVPRSLWDKDDTVFAHRVVYRTKVNVPASHKGRAFRLEFDGTNWLASVFINGKLAGTHQGVWVPWTLDVSDRIRPGEVNQIDIVIKGPYYAVDAASMDGTITQRRNTPRDFLRWTRWVAPIYPSTKGDGNGVDYGIVNPLRLVSLGETYTEDVFIKPSLTHEELVTDVTLRNTGDVDRALQVRCEAVNDDDNTVAKTFGPIDVTVPAGQTITAAVQGPWADPKLWWPQTIPEGRPNLYRLRTTILDGDRLIDVSEELFGFREVTIDGTGVLINGVRRNFWNWVDVTAGGNLDEMLAAFHAQGNRFMRFSQDHLASRFLHSRKERLEWYDRHGIPGRLCTMIDGMFISYNLGNNKNGQFTLNEPVWKNFREHMAQVAKAYRNHPSVIEYQVENELVYINGQNLHGGQALDQIEEAMAKVAESGRAIDPTRPYGVGGAGDLSGRLEINEPHYPAGQWDWYPENAYTIERLAPHVARWPWKRDKPWQVGESAFAAEIPLGSYVLGDEAYRSRDDANRGKAKYLRMLYGGYRWTGANGFFPWDILARYDDALKVFQPLYVVPWKQTSRLYGGRENELKFKVMNDTLSDEIVTLEWSYEVNGKVIAGASLPLKIKPGFGKEITLAIEPPRTDQRIDGTLTLRTRQGTELYEDVRNVPVLPWIHSIESDSPILVLDTSDTVGPFLDRAGAKFQKIDSLDDLKIANGLLIVGPDSLSARDAFGSALLAFAARGGKVIVLEQENPLGGAQSPHRADDHRPSRGLRPPSSPGHADLSRSWQGRPHRLEGRAPDVQESVREAGSGCHQPGGRGGGTALVAVDRGACRERGDAALPAPCRCEPWHRPRGRRPPAERHRALRSLCAAARHRRAVRSRKPGAPRGGAGHRSDGRTRFERAGRAGPRAVRRADARGQRRYVIHAGRQQEQAGRLPARRRLADASRSGTVGHRRL